MVELVFGAAQHSDRLGAFGRRGILMERHSVDEPAAFEMLRDDARSANQKLMDIASAVVHGHRLQPKQPD